jgi:hypothetical protein
VAVDEGLRDQTLRRLRDAIQERRGELGRTRELLQLARLEDDAQAVLDPAVNVLLVDAGIVDQLDVTELQAVRDRLAAEVDAIQALADAVRAL